MKKKEIYIISATYPYSKGEEFMEKELAELSKYFSKIHLFPLYTEGERRSLPKEVNLNLSLSQVDRKLSYSFYFKNFISALNILLTEFFAGKKRGAIIRNFRELMNSALQSKKLSFEFKKHISKNDENYFYSVWMNDGALVLAILKKAGFVDRNFFRLHGFDLFDERRRDQYMPFRYFNFKYSDKIFVLSKAGFDYITAKDIFREKIVMNYSGLYDNGINLLESTRIFTIVSCSRIIQLKRVDRIIEVLKLLDMNLRWMHFGGGDLMDFCKTKAKELGNNIQYEFMGQVSNHVIIDFYKNNSVNLFLHMSESEGLGMAIVEAQSFGIPALAVNTGGVNEVVNDTTGILVENDMPNESIANLIREIYKGRLNNPRYRKIIKKHWESKFNAVSNYRYFCEQIFLIK